MSRLSLEQIVALREATGANLAFSDYDADVAFARAVESAVLSKLRVEGVQVAEPVADDPLPVRYYKDGGVTHAVYGSSSITYVEKLRATLASAPVARERFRSDVRELCAYAEGLMSVHIDTVRRVRAVVDD